MRTLSLIVFSSGLFAQSTANIVGIVRDSSGGAIPGVRITATNVLTGLRETRESTAEGTYSLPLLPVGQYRVEAEKQGFQRYVRSGVTLVVNDNANIDITLQIGSLTESINVTAEAPLLETQTGTIRGVVDQQRIVELPLNGRQITQLLAIQAGVIQRSSGTSEGDAFVVNGSRQSGVYFLLDGGMNTDSYRNYSGVFPNPDAVQEFSIQKSNFSAEYANATGAVVSVATKSGTNQFHGSAFEFLRNGAFNARNFFAARRDSLKRSQFGGAFGGPAIKDKLFFFTSYQGTRTRSDPQLTRQFLPTAAMRSGDFSAVRPITDPQTRLPFPGNQIPVSRISPVTQALLNYIPDPGTADGQRFVGVPLKTSEEEFTAKVDANLGAHRLVGRYFFQRFERPFTGKTDDLASMFASEVGALDATLSQSHVQRHLHPLPTGDQQRHVRATLAPHLQRLEFRPAPHRFSSGRSQRNCRQGSGFRLCERIRRILSPSWLELRQEGLRRPHFEHLHLARRQPRNQIRW